LPQAKYAPIIAAMKTAAEGEESEGAAAKATPASAGAPGLCHVWLGSACGAWQR
jgi:hypothetical protein